MVSSPFACYVIVIMLENIDKRLASPTNIVAKSLPFEFPGIEWTLKVLSQETTCQCNKLPIKIVYHGRPAICLFTFSCRNDLLHGHVTRGDQMCVQHVALIQSDLNSCHKSQHQKLHKNIQVTQGKLSRRHVAATSHLVWQDLKNWTKDDHHWSSLNQAEIFYLSRVSLHSSW